MMENFVKLMIRIIRSAVGCLWLPGNWAQLYKIQLICGRRCVYISCFITALNVPHAIRFYSSGISLFSWSKHSKVLQGSFQMKSALQIIFNYRTFMSSVQFLRTVFHTGHTPSPVCDVILKGKYWGQLMFIPLQTCSDTFSGDNIPQ